MSLDRLLGGCDPALAYLQQGRSQDGSAGGGKHNLERDDNALKNRLNYYYTVSVLDDSASADTSKNLIVISASVDPALVGTKYKSTPRGVVVMKPELFDDMGMTATGAFGTLPSQTMLKINDATRQMAAGFQPRQFGRLYSSGKTIGWGTPTAGAARIAVTADGNTSHVTIFGYSSGQAMASLTAPGRRVGYYLINPSSLTVNGWKLFDYAVDWADGGGAPVSGGSTAAISWSAPSTITRYAAGCGNFSPTWAPDDQLYSSYGDCNGVTGTLTPKRSMGYAQDHRDGHRTPFSSTISIRVRLEPLTSTEPTAAVVSTQPVTARLVRSRAACSM